MQTTESGPTRIGVPPMGAYGRLLKQSINNALKDMDIDNVTLELAPPITRKTVDRGTQYMDENMCLPAKILLGNILEMNDKGIDVAVEWDNCGECRQKAYWLIHQSVLRQIGVNTKVRALQPNDLTGWLMEIIPDFPRSKQRVFIRRILRDLWEHDSRMMEKQAAPSEDAPKIGICGEIYTVLEPAANLDLMARLKKAGAYVHNALPLSHFLYHDLMHGENKLKWSLIFSYLGMYRELRQWCLGSMQRPDVDTALYNRARKETEYYLPKKSVGGHGKESITWTIYYALAGFDSVIHIMPFPCMPEATTSVIIDEVAKDYGIPVNHFVFDQQFGEQNIITRAEALVNMIRFKKKGLDSTLNVRRPGYWLGLDVGSTSTKAVLLDGETLEVVDEEYQFTNRNPINAIKSVITTIGERNPGKEITGGATTGSGRRLAKALLDAPLAVDEINCQTIGCMLADRSIRSIIEIGGQDSKFISLDENGVPNWFSMNSICSAGTGSFLSSAAREFKVPVEELGACARSAKCGVNVTGRCGVFAESDIVSKQQAGYPVNAIAKGMCRALAQNFLNNICRSRKVEGPVMFSGAVALNESVADAFGELSGEDIHIHPRARISGALGAAFISMAQNARGGFTNFDAETSVGSQIIHCTDCANDCEVSFIHRDNHVVCALNSRCGKYEKYCGLSLEEVLDKVGFTETGAVEESPVEVA